MIEREIMRILVADGNDVLLDLLESFLRDRGHRVTLARDGLECARELRRLLPDVVLLERNLLWGGSDGVIALMQDRLGPATPPVILMTDRNDALHDDDSSPSLVVESLPKPFRLSAITRSLDAAVGRIRARSHAVESATAPCDEPPLSAS